MIKNRTTQGYILNTLVIAILLIGFSFIKESFGKAGDFKLIIAPSIWQCCYLIILAASLNMTLGFLGQLSLGHCGFMAIGAYAAALLSLAAERAGVFEQKSGTAFLLVALASIGFLRRRSEMVGHASQRKHTRGHPDEAERARNDSR